MNQSNQNLLQLMEQNEKRSQRRFSNLFLSLSNKYLSGMDISDPDWQPPDQLSPVKAISFDRFATSNKIKVVIKKRKYSEVSGHSGEESENEKLLTQIKPCSVVINRINVPEDSKSITDKGVNQTASERLHDVWSVAGDSPYKVQILSERPPVSHGFIWASPEGINEVLINSKQNTDLSNTSKNGKTSLTDTAAGDYMSGNGTVCEAAEPVLLEMSGQDKTGGLSSVREISASSEETGIPEDQSDTVLHIPENTNKDYSIHKTGRDFIDGAPSVHEKPKQKPLDLNLSSLQPAWKSRFLTRDDLVSAYAPRTYRSKCGMREWTFTQSPNGSFYEITRS
ncbi:Hypothetical predicted protein [Cloeon dipterum]|uniref:Uncharacterized protein n=1 Tax=Cloeon dipterum TaxID=197152 RepID=A0A8S1DQW3_9INSE|nr:Hypothetical predicted protein [Cloeon dipterum]